MRDPLPTNRTMRFRAHQRARLRERTSKDTLGIMLAMGQAEKSGFRQGVEAERKRVTEFRTLQSDRNRLDTPPRHQYIEYPLYSEADCSYPGPSVSTNSSFRVVRFRAVENAIVAEGRVFKFTSWVLDR